MAICFRKNHKILVHERDIPEVLQTINQNHIACEFWCSGRQRKWYVEFKSTERKYANIIKALLKIGGFYLEVSGYSVVDICFRKGS